MCIFHKWGKWSEYYIVNGDVSYEKRQDRQCFKCCEKQDIYIVTGVGKVPDIIREPKGD